MPKLLIVGCGRSGTRYASKVLKAAALDVGHERPGADGMANWRSVACEEDLRSHDVVWHQVREPLGVIASFHTVMGRSWDFVCQVEPRVPRSDPVLLRCMKYWLYWNELCESAADRTYRVESFLEGLPAMAGALGRELSQADLEAARKVPRNDHTRRRGHKVSGSYPVLSWGDLVAAEPDVAAEIGDQAKRYGYEFSK
jgi:hypothetical protein